eukprot:6868634-Prorocentrum_lima.AAC.1
MAEGRKIRASAMAYQPQRSAVPCAACRKMAPYFKLVESWRSEHHDCSSCELEYLQREWSLFTEAERVAYLRALDFMDVWTEKIRFYNVCREKTNVNDK